MDIGNSTKKIVFKLKLNRNRNFRLYDLSGLYVNVVWFTFRSAAGRTITQMVSYWPLTIYSWVFMSGESLFNVWWRMWNWTCFSLSAEIFSGDYNFTSCPYSYFIHLPSPPYNLGNYCYH